MGDNVTNVLFAGLGGQGVLKASDILADAAFDAGLEVKKSELHGMSQRGGSVSSGVRFGTTVHSPMIPHGEADILVVLADDQVENNQAQLRAGGLLITPAALNPAALKSKRSLNVALLGTLSRHLPLAEKHWRAAIAANLPQKVQAMNFSAFDLGKAAASP